MSAFNIARALERYAARADFLLLVQTYVLQKGKALAERYPEVPLNVVTLSIELEWYLDWTPFNPGTFDLSRFVRFVVDELWGKVDEYRLTDEDIERFRDHLESLRKVRS